MTAPLFGRMARMQELILDIFADAAIDTLKLIPFLLVTYLVMEWIEHRAGNKAQEAVRKAGVAGPAIGAVLGVVPQCGFSAAASTLYAGRVITLGTLIAVFLSTSDEMLPIFIAENAPITTILAILAIKAVIGLAAGFAIDGIARLAKKPQESLKIHELCERDRCDCAEDCEECLAHPEEVYSHRDDCGDDCDHTHHRHEHSHDAEHGFKHIFVSACKHTIEVTIFVFIISLVLNGVMELVGEEALAGVVGSNEALSIVVSAVVGLIPNCGASVAIAQLYLEGVLGTGAMLSGLLVASGVGLLVLFRANRPMRQNALIALGLLAFGIIVGFAFAALGIVL